MPILCEVCRKEIKEGGNLSIRKLNNRSHYCCSLQCEVEWEKENLVGVCG